MVVPLYIGEIAPTRLRGALVSLNQLAITVGILVSYLVDFGLASSENWRMMFGLAAIPAAVLFLGMLVRQESPPWLIARGREDEARTVLARVRQPQDIEPEIRELREVATRRSASARELLSPRVRHVVMVGVALAVSQQITGINTIIYYAPTLLAKAGFGASAALLANVGVGVVNVGMTVVAIWLMDRAGRRPLLLAGTFGMLVALLMVALSFLLGGPRLAGAATATALIGPLLYTGSFAVGLGPIFWLLISEVYPARIRGRAMSVATIANWGSNFIVTVTFLSLLSAVGGVGAFLLFAFLTAVALVFLAAQVPETKNRSLAEVERDLTLTGELAAGRRPSGPAASGAQ